MAHKSGADEGFRGKQKVAPQIGFIMNQFQKVNGMIGKIVTALWALFSLSHPAFSETYSYAGNLFEGLPRNLAEVDGEWIAGTHRVTGSFTTSAELGDYSIQTDISSIPGLLTSWSFTHGRGVYNETNSFIETFFLTTLNGVIQEWNISFTSGPLFGPNEVNLSEGEVFTSLLTRSGFSGTNDNGKIHQCVGALCVNRGDPDVALEMYSNLDNAGTWTVAQVPLPGGLWLLCVGLAGLIGLRRAGQSGGVVA